MYEEIKIKTETYYALQKIRIQAQLRIQALSRDERLDESESHAMHLWMDERLQKAEQEIFKEVKLLLKGIPIWEEWFKKVKGIGPCLAGSLMAGIQDIGRFEYVSSLWKYMGQDVRDGEAPRRKKGQKIDWNPFLRMTMHKITDSFIKQNADNSLYRRLYDEKKGFYQKQFPAWQNGGEPHPTRTTKDGKSMMIHTKNHLHFMAKRFAGKIFIQHTWLKWRELEGLKVTEPWIIAHGGHSHYIEPEF